MTNCGVYWELMSCALDGALTDEECRRLEDHLARCPECRELFEQMQNLHGDMPGMEAAPAGFVDGVMEKAAVTEQVIPFTNLPQNRDIRKESRDQLKHWWRPIKQWGAIAACCLIILGVGTMADRSGLFSAENSSGASAPTADSCQQESQVLADEAVSGVDEKPAANAAEDGFGEYLEPGSALDGEMDCEVTIEWEGARYASTGDMTPELPEGFLLGGDVSLALSSTPDVRWEVYTGGGDEIYIRIGEGYERWIKIEE